MATPTSAGAPVEPGGLEREPSQPAHRRLFEAFRVTVAQQQADPQRVAETDVTDLSGESAHALEVTAIERGAEHRVGHAAGRSGHERMFARAQDRTGAQSIGKEG
jgi:hypothetical protein